MRDKLRIVLMLLGITGCATPQILYSPAQELYVSKAMAEASDFTVPNGSRDQVWGRAQAFIGRFRFMKIQTLSDYVIQTYIPDNESAPSLSLTESPKGDSAFITIESTQILDTVASARLEHVLSYYMFYGDEPPGDLIPRLESDVLGLQADGSPRPMGAGSIVLSILGVLALLVVLALGAASSGTGGAQ